jgi:multidrug resistance efflux pump
MKIRFDAPPGAGQDPTGVAVRYAAAKRQVPRWRWYLLLALVLAPPAYLALRFLMGLLWAQVPASVVLDQSVVRVPASGVVARLVRVGDVVPAGAAVLQMRAVAPPPAASARPAQPAAQASAPARERMLREAVALAAQQVALRRDRLARLEALAAQAAATRPEVEAARAQWLQAQAELNRAQGELNEHRAARSSRPLPVAPEVADLPAAPAVHAPFEARVAQVYLHAGEWQPAGTEALLLQSTAPALVQAYVDPSRAQRVQPGRRATLRFADGHRVPAEVVEIISHVERLPAERVSPLSPRTPSLLVKLRPLEPLPERLRIHALPLDVRFDGLW